MSTVTRIPIANIFYMLAYAWDIPPTWEKKLIDQSDYDSLWELLSRLLIESADGLFKRGLARDYVLQEETIDAEDVDIIVTCPKLGAENEANIAK